MATTHMKRIAAPRTWPILRKINTFIRRPNPGAQSFQTGMSISTWLVETLKVATNAREARVALRSGAIHVNGKPVSDPSLPVGLFDVISITTDDLHYMIVLSTKNTLTAIPLSTYDGTKLSRIKRKHKAKEGKIHYTTMEGYTFIDEKAYAVGDTVIIDLSKKAIRSSHPLKKGSQVYFIRGYSVGKYGTVTEDISTTEVEIHVDEKTVKTHKDVVIVIEGYTPIQSALKTMHKREDAQ